MKISSCFDIMSRRRSIQKKIHLQFDPYLLQQPDASYHSYFGEKVQSENDDIVNDSYLLRLENSSDCSTSDSEYTDNESTIKISYLIEKCIYGEPQLNTDDEWENRFANIRIIGRALTVPYLCHHENKDSDEVLYEHKDFNLKFRQTNHLHNHIKTAVINNILKVIQAKLDLKNKNNTFISSELKTPKLFVKHDAIEDNNNNNKEIILEVSPLLRHRHTMTLSEYQSPVMRSHLSASKWQRRKSFTDDSYLLPNIYSHGSANVNAKRKDKMSHCSASSSKKISEKISMAKKSFSVASTRMENVTLPPILK